MAPSLLTTSARSQIADPAVAAAAAGDLGVEATIHRAGEVTGGFTEAIARGGCGWCSSWLRW